MICSGLFVFTCKSLREGTFFLGGGGLGPQRGGSSVKVHPERGGGGGVMPLCKLFKGRVTHLFQIFFLLKIFVMLFSVFLTD